MHGRIAINKRPNPVGSGRNRPVDRVFEQHHVHRSLPVRTDRNRPEAAGFKPFSVRCVVWPCRSGSPAPPMQLYSQATTCNALLHGILDLAIRPAGHDLTKVDRKAFKVGAASPFAMQKVELFPGVTMFYAHPARLIPYLWYHPCLHEGMWKEPQEVRVDRKRAAGQGQGERQREYSHPFTCNRALEAHGRLQQEHPGAHNVLDMSFMFKDKTSLGRGEKASLDVGAMKKGNTGEKQFWLNESKVQAFVFPYLDQRDMEDEDFKMLKRVIHQKGWAFYLILLEVCAERGLPCCHRCVGVGPQTRGQV